MEKTKFSSDITISMYNWLLIKVTKDKLFLNTDLSLEMFIFILSSVQELFLVFSF